MLFHSANEYDRIRGGKSFRLARWPAQPPTDTWCVKGPTVEVQRPPPSSAEVKN